MISFSGVLLNMQNVFTRVFCQFARTLPTKTSVTFRQPCRCYRAAIFKQLNESLVVEDFKQNVEKLGEREVLVQVCSAGVNLADVNMFHGYHQIKPKLPCIPGFEFSGEVIEAGPGVTRFRTGDRVLGLMTNTTGAFAELCKANEDELYPIPHTLSYDIAASLPVAYGTALLALTRYAAIEQGQTVLVLTTQGSSGIAAVDLAINFFKCQVIACTDTLEKSAVIRPKGVQTVFEVKEPKDLEQLEEIVRKHTGNKGADIVVDTVGGSWLESALKCTKPCGSICSLGFSSGVVPTVSVLEIIERQANLSGVWLGGYANYRPDRFHKLIEDIISHISDEFIDPYIAASFELEKVNEAFSYIEAKSSIGKVVLKIT